MSVPTLRNYNNTSKENAVFDKKVHDNRIRQPLVTVVTPVLNGSKYLAQAIDSILGQSYPHIELIIIDGLSDDGTIEIIKKYDHRIKYWSSSKDSGAADAINKGFEVASGDIFVWLNYDDLYYPNTVEMVIEDMNRTDASFCYGHSQLIDKNRKVFKTLYTCEQSINSYQADGGNIFQGTVFFRRELWGKYGPLDSTLKCSFEYKLFDNFFEFEKGVFINSILAQYRIHEDTISANYKDQFAIECKTFRSNHSRLYAKMYYRLKRNAYNLRDGNFIPKYWEFFVNFLRRKI
jgi:glycosyltransferase involved in cell wall biosynthesis